MKKRLYSYKDISKIEKLPREYQKSALRQARETLLKAWDIHKSNTLYGIDVHTDEQKAICLEWYQNLCDLNVVAFKEIPDCIKKYLKE